MKIGNQTLKPNPHITQEYKGKKGRVTLWGKDKRYPSMYGKHYYTMLFKFEDGGKILLTSDYSDNCIKEEQL